MNRSIAWLLAMLAVITVSQGVLWNSGRALLDGVDPWVNLPVALAAGAAWIAALSRAWRALVPAWRPVTVADRDDRPTRKAGRR